MSPARIARSMAARRLTAASRDAGTGPHSWVLPCRSLQQRGQARGPMQTVNTCCQALREHPSRSPDAACSVPGGQQGMPCTHMLLRLAKLPAAHDSGMVPVSALSRSSRVVSCGKPDPQVAGRGPMKL